MDHRYFLSQAAHEEVTAEEASSDFAARYGEHTLLEWWQDLWGR
jgi:hypothetical protein